MFTNPESVFSRLFAALAALNTREILPVSPVFVDLLETYGALYPDQLAAQLILFVDTTYGATVDARIAAQTESLARLGRTGDERYVAALKGARSSLSELHEMLVKKPALLHATLGADIWLLARAEPALAVNLNTAG